MKTKPLILVTSIGLLIVAVFLSLRHSANQQLAARQLAITRMACLKEWVSAFISFAKAHDGQLPKSFAEAETYLSNPLHAPGDTNKLEIVYEGSLTELFDRTTHDPAQTLLIRERQPTTYHGGIVAKFYAFADGHAEIHKQGPEGFDQWENARILKHAPK